MWIEQKDRHDPTVTIDRSPRDLESALNNDRVLKNKIAGDLVKDLCGRSHEKISISNLSLNSIFA